MGLVGIVGTSTVLIPLIALGLTYYQYNSADPESRPTDAKEKETTFTDKVKSKEPLEKDAMSSTTQRPNIAQVGVIIVAFENHVQRHIPFRRYEDY
ncbi:hypothetical protein KQX54_015117 [Cotesia glomerata]|uniref:Uncharacterized protein n=1 Tax=Cotesia glomerata TaxID=32391 RepID=A0AAV7IE84_COTGL|nr:hypothetical protein KQX54_015117 [Cotesia glomerata]